MTDWTAEMVREKLRARHPATGRMGVRIIPGPWTCIEEWMGIDLLAICATSSPARGRTCGQPYPRVGYEVKVSRGDYRSELRNPGKRFEARSCCHEFYFAVPRGLLHDDELPGDDGQPQLGDEGDLYVPDDVGLVVVDGRGTQVVKESPVNREPDPPFLEVASGLTLGALIRWVSARPDPRHEGVVERAREDARRVNAAVRESRRRHRDAIQAISEGEAA